MGALEAHFRSRSAEPAFLLIVDIDHFKRINDTHGHNSGDLVLCRVAEALNNTARQGDLICRLGGEEFVVVAFGSDGAGVLQLAERMRAAIENLEVPDATRNQIIRCTATIGLSHSFDNLQAFDECLQQADAALYLGKAAGRNRVEWAPYDSQSWLMLPGQDGHLARLCIVDDKPRSWDQRQD